MELPKRKHDGCDDMCSECVEWMGRIFELTKPIAQEAMKAFWNVVEARLPQCAPNTLTASDLRDMREFCEEAVGHFAVNGLPLPELKVTAEGRPIKKVLRFEPAARQNVQDADWLPFRR
jgi:hypothetical protein